MTTSITTMPLGMGQTQRSRQMLWKPAPASLSPSEPESLDLQEEQKGRLQLAGAGLCLRSLGEWRSGAQEESLGAARNSWP